MAGRDHNKRWIPPSKRRESESQAGTGDRARSDFPAIEAMWLEYRKVALPAEATVNQVYLIRMAFYAGFASLLSQMMEIGDDDSVDEDSGALILEGYREELVKHVARIRSEGGRG